MQGTIIDGEGLTGSLVTFQNLEASAVLDGFSLLNGSGTPFQVSIGGSPVPWGGAVFAKGPASRCRLPAGRTP